MKIHDTGPIDSLAGATSGIHIPLNKTSTSSDTLAPDETTLGTIASATNDALAAPEAKVAQLREQYLNGSYHVDAEKISSKIVDEHLESKI